MSKSLKKSAGNSSKREGGSVRIIGGDLRSRKLNFPAVEGLRPTADRVRETLFNWLQLSVPAARVLDVFAGSGALGFEAASRGASAVVMIERDRDAANSLRANKLSLDTTAVQIVEADALAWLRAPQANEQFDVVFIDPPFDAQLHYQVAQALVASGCLTSGALVYIESAQPLEAAQLPDNWQQWKFKKAGAVYSTLFVVN